jgi:dipeptidyl aminopeptidase/acylaminoacyl peptidase
MKGRTARMLVWAGIVAGLLAAAAPGASQARKRLINLDDLARMKTVGDPQVSPDGRWVAYTLGTVDAEKDRRDTDLWMVSWDGTTTVQLTFTPEDSESQPRWSPDNRYLAFLATRGDEALKKLGPQVWLLDRTGGEAQPLTSIRGGVAEFAWAPDGRRLVLVANEPDPDADPEQKEGWKRKTPPPIVIRRYHFKQDREGYLRERYTYLALFDLATRTVEPLTKDRFDERSPAWSPDGQRVVFVSNRTADPDRNRDTNLWVVEAKPGAEPRPLTTFPGSDGGRPAWSPDGGWIAYLQGDETRYLAYQLNKLAIVPAAGGAPRVLTASLDRPVSDPLVWTPDSRQVLFTVSDDRVRYVGRVNIEGGAVERLTSGRRIVSNLSAGPAGRLALLSGTASEATEVYALEQEGLRRLTHHNDALFAELDLGPTEEVTSRSKDGTEVHGLVVKPPFFEPGRRYPLVLLIHGGPNAQDEHVFSFERQYLAANGYVVLSVNYRGSAGRGAAFQKAIFADWGNKEVLDLLGAVDHLVAIGLADPDRLGIGGWSYGGILTNYTIATDSRFKAAVSGAGSSLQLSMYGVDQYIVQYEQELGPPWKASDLWLKVSYPFFRADRIKTPTLFLGGEKDFNVPLVGSEQMYQALKSLGVDTELVIYPNQYHSLTVPSYQRDRLARYLAWFDRYLKGGKPTDAARR